MLQRAFSSERFPRPSLQQRIGLICAAALVLLCAALLTPSAQAQPSAPPEPTPFADQIVGWDRTAAWAERVLAAEGPVRPEALERLRGRLIEQRSGAQALQTRLQNQLTPLQNQLAALGEPPAEGVFEGPDLADRRRELTTRIAELENQLKETGLALTRAASLQERLARRQREQFTATLFTRGHGPLDKAAWQDLAADAPQFRSAVETQWRAILRDYDPSGEHALITLAVSLAGFLALFGRRQALRSARGLAQAAVSTSLYTLRIIYTFLEFVLRAAPLPLAASLLALVIVEIADPTEFQRLVLRRLVEMFAIVAAVGTLARMAFRAEPTSRRAIDLEPRRGALIAFAVTSFAAVVAVDRLALDLLERAGATQGTLSIGNALIALLAALPLLVLAGQIRITSAAKSAEVQLTLTELDDIEETRDEFDWRSGAVALMRAALIVCALTLIIAAVLGYYALARFTLNGAAMTGLLFGVAALVYVAATRLLAPSLAAPLTQATAEGEPAAAAPPEADRASALIRLLVLVVLVLVSAPLLGLIWGGSKSDILSLTAMLFGGVQVGDSVFSLGDFFIAILVLLTGLWLTRLVQRLLNRSVLPSMRLSAGPRTAISAGVGYIGFFITSLAAISSAGFDLSNLAIIAGALSVGIGFGLQNVVNNFVSGLILLIERPIQPGDWVEVGGYSGNVKRINVRSTEITSFDRASVIVPNSELISASVVNWTHKNLIGRAIVGVGVGYDSDPEMIADILRETALEHPMVLKTPAPFVYFKDFGASSLDFEVRCYLRDVNNKLSVESDLRFELLKRLRAKGVEIPFPQRVVHTAGGGERREPPNETVGETPPPQVD